MRKKSIQTTKNIASHVDKNPVDPLDIIKENASKVVLNLKLILKHNLQKLA